MKSYATSAVLLCLLLTVGCSDRGDNSSAQNADEAKTPPPATEPAAGQAAAPAPPSGDSAEGARATGGTRANRPASSNRAPARSDLAARPADERSAASAPAAPRAEFRELSIPAGTALPLELETELSSETAQVETPVRARLKQAIAVDGVTALPAGAVLIGDVTEVERAGRVKGRARLVLAFNRIQADNMTGELRTNPVTFVGEASKGEDATKIGAGAVGGAVLGGILGGKGGAAKGAAIGGAAGSGVVLATRGKEVELGKGADVAAVLAAPFTIRVPVR